MSEPEKPKKRGCCLKVFVGFVLLVGALYVRSVQNRPVFDLARGEGPVHAIAFAGSGSLLVTRTNDMIRVFSLPSGQCVALKSDTLGSTRRRGSALVLPAGDAVICESTIYSLPDLAVRGKLPGDAIALSPDGEAVALLGSGISVHSVKTGEKLFALAGSTEGSRVALSRAPYVLAAMSDLSTIAVWNDQGVIEGKIGVSGNRPVGWAFDSARRLWIAGAYGAVKRFDAWTAPAPVAADTLRIRCDAGFLRHVASFGTFDLGRGVLAWGSDMGSVQIRTLDTGASLWDRGGAHLRGVTAMAVSSDGKWVASGAGECVVYVWRVD